MLLRTNPIGILGFSSRLLVRIPEAIFVAGMRYKQPGRYWRHYCFVRCMFPSSLMDIAYTRQLASERKPIAYRPHSPSLPRVGVLS